jgi:ribonuclease T1
MLQTAPIVKDIIRTAAPTRYSLLRGLRRGAVAVLAGLSLMAAVQARETPEKPAAPAAMPTIAVADLPREGRKTLELIKKGGPFPYNKDGTTFHNRERLLPRQPRGYYSEYTVRTPFSRDRGARRIVAGKGSTGDPATSGEYYYTADHYRSFARIKE